MRHWGWRQGLTLFLFLGAAVVAGLLRTRPPSVQTVVLETRDLQRTLVVVGQVRPPSRAGLGSAISGVVREVRVREGDQVERGELLLRLEDREALAAVSEAEAALVEVTAMVQSEIEQAELELAQAERELGRIRTIFAEGGLTQQRLEEAERRVADGRSRLTAAQASVGLTDTNAAVARARSALEGALARLELTRIVAPSSGTVLTRLAEPGDAVQPGRVLLEVASEGPTEVIAFPAEENLPRLQLGARAVVSADAYPNDRFEAVVSRIAPVVDPLQGTVELRLEVPDPPSYLRPDMTLSVSIAGEARSAVPVLPLDAVRGAGTAEPWVGIAKEGRLERRPVVLGLRGEDLIEILSGVEVGEAVLLGGASLAPGDRLRPVN